MFERVLLVVLVGALVVDEVPGGTQVTARVSLDSAGIQGDDDSGTGFGKATSISDDGRWVAFRSSATNLVAGDTNGLEDIFLHDRQSGMTIRVNLGPGGVQADGDSQTPVVSGDGRYVGFTSYASNLVVGDTNGVQDAFLRDTWTGTTERISLDSVEQEGNGGSEIGDMTPDGAFVTFFSLADNLVAGDTNGYGDVFVRDRVVGRTLPISHNPITGFGNQASGASSISADGRYVAFVSKADNLAVLPDPYGTAIADVLVKDRLTLLTQRVGTPAGWFGDSLNPSISHDGRYVAFDNTFPCVPGDTNGHRDCFRHDLVTGTTIRFSEGTGGLQGNAPSSKAELSGDGLFAVFDSQANNLVPQDNNGFADVFVHEFATQITKQVSVETGGMPGTGFSGHISIDATGATTAFSTSGALVTEDSNVSYDVYVRTCPAAAVSKYCQGKLTSEGCVASIDWSGSPAASQSPTFWIEGQLVPGFKSGLLYYGTSGPQFSPFQGGTMCVAPPRKRTPVQSSGGDATSCSGRFGYDMAARIASGVDPELVEGQTVWCQWWFRDPSAASTTGLTDALEFTVLP